MSRLLVVLGWLAGAVVAVAIILGIGAQDLVAGALIGGACGLIGVALGLIAAGY